MRRPLAATALPLLLALPTEAQIATPDRPVTDHASLHRQRRYNQRDPLTRTVAWFDGYLTPVAGQ